MNDSSPSPEFYEMSAYQSWWGQTLTLDFIYVQRATYIIFKELLDQMWKIVFRAKYFAQTETVGGSRNSVMGQAFYDCILVVTPFLLIMHKIELEASGNHNVSGLRTPFEATVPFCFSFFLLKKSKITGTNFKHSCFS